MTFEQIVIFSEVFRQRSITKAANNLYVSRQSLSASIKKLEEEYGVVLFNRLSNGVEPTVAGEEFYNSAQIIFNEYMMLQQNMEKYQGNSKKIEICTIGIAESLMPQYGDKILKKLTAVFPDTYFDILSINSFEDPLFYQAFEASIILPFSQRKEEFVIIDRNEYIFNSIKSFPVSVWVSANSSWNGYSELNFELLNHTPFCVLKNSLNGLGTLNYLKKEHHYDFLNSYLVIDLIENFIDRIERRGYFTIDFPMKKGKLCYSELFAGRNIVLKDTPYTVTCGIICHKKYAKKLYPVLADIITF